MTINTEKPEDTQNLGIALGEKLRPGDVLALYGGLGAGKTTFITGLAKRLGIKSNVSSPTYTIVNEYLGEVPLFNFDMYRLSSSDELFEIGWEDYLSRGGIIAVEWSENVSDAFEAGTIEVVFEKTGDNSRKISIKYPEDRGILSLC